MLSFQCLLSLDFKKIACKSILRPSAVTQQVAILSSLTCALNGLVEWNIVKWHPIACSIHVFRTPLSLSEIFFLGKPGYSNWMVESRSLWPGVINFWIQQSDSHQLLHGIIHCWTFKLIIFIILTLIKISVCYFTCNEAFIVATSMKEIVSNYCINQVENHLTWKILLPKINCFQSV